MLCFNLWGDKKPSSHNIVIPHTLIFIHFSPTALLHTPFQKYIQFSVYVYIYFWQSCKNTPVAENAIIT